MIREKEAAMARFCANCGAPLSDDSRFCEECGTPVEQGGKQNNNGQQMEPGSGINPGQNINQGPQNGSGSQVPPGQNINRGAQNGPGPQYGPGTQVPPGAQTGPRSQYSPGPNTNPASQNGPRVQQYGPVPQGPQVPPVAQNGPMPQQYGPGPQYQQPAPKKKSNTGLIVGLIIAAGAAVALILFFVSPFGRNLIAKKGNDPAATASISSADIASSKSSEKISSAKESSKTSSEKALSAQTSESKASSARTSSAPASSAKASSAKPSQSDFSSLSTTEVPEYVDFLWFWEDVYHNGSPAAKEMQGDFSALAGSWKALVYIDPGNTMDSESYDLSTYTFEGTEDFVTLKTKRHTFVDLRNSEIIDASNEGSSTWHGKFENGAITFDGPGSIRIDEIYTYNGREYALGHYYYPSGENGPLALVRP